MIESIRYNDLICNSNENQYSSRKKNKRNFIHIN